MAVSNGRLFVSMLKNARCSALNREFIGYTIRDRLEPVRGDETAAYAAATSDLNPLYQGPEAMAPPFYVSRLIWDYIKRILIQDGLGLNFLRMVHGQQSVTWHRPVMVGDALDMEMTVRDIISTSSGDLMQLGGAVLKDGEVAAEAVSGLFIRGREAGKSRGKKKREERPEPLFTREISTEPGQNLRYAGASGDTSYIHTNRVISRLAGFPGPIMHGVCLMAMTCASLAEETIAGDLNRLTGMEARFVHWALPGESLTLRAYRGDGGDRLGYDVVNAGGKIILGDGQFQYK